VHKTLDWLIVTTFF